MFNRFRKLFIKNRRQDREPLTEPDDVIPEEIPEQIPICEEKRHEAIHQSIFSLPSGSEVIPQQIPPTPMSEKERFDAINRSLFGPPLGAESSDQRSRSTSNASNLSFENPLYEPQPVPTVQQHSDRYGDFSTGKYTFSKNFEQDIEMFNEMGVIIETDERIGRGSSGALIYKGYYSNISEEMNGKQFAVKVFRFDNADEARDQIEKEKKIMHIIVHKYLVNVHYIFNMGDIHDLKKYEDMQYVGYTSSDRIYILMDFGDLGNIFKYFKTNPKFNSNELRAMTFQLLEGLRYLHSIGIVHGDLHILNVLMCSLPDAVDLNTLTDGNSTIGIINVNFTAKLADFGLSEMDNSFRDDCNSMALHIFKPMIGNYCTFDTEEDNDIFYELINKMKSRDCTTLQIFYQSIEFRNWFKIQ